MIIFYSSILILNLVLIFFHNKLDKIGIPYDLPDKVRKFHSKKVLISGGLIIVLNVIFFLFYLNLTKNYLIKEIFFLNNFNLFIYTFLILSFYFLGFIDDKKNINPNKKLLILGILYYILILSNDIFMIKSIKLSFLDNEYFLKYLSYPITILCFLLFSNATNMYDGINLQNFFYYFSLILFFLINNIFFQLFILLFIPILVYGYLNFKNKSFLGDGGCYVLSFFFGSIFVACYNLNYIEFADTIFFLMILPGIDMLRLFTIRILKKKNPFIGDRDHIHHKLLNEIGFQKTTFTLAIFQLLIILSLIIKVNAIILITLLLFFYFLILFFCDKKVKN